MEGGAAEMGAAAGAVAGVIARRGLLALPLGLGLGSATAAQPLTLSTACQAGVPLKFAPQNPERPGICIEIAQALQRLEPRLRFSGLERELPLKRIESDLASGQIEVFFALLHTPERVALGLQFLEQPLLYALRHVVAVRADDPVQVSTLDDIRRLGRDGQILTAQGTAYPQVLDDVPGLRVDASSSSNSQLLRMLLAGRGRFVYHGDATLRAQIRADGLDAQIRILPAVFKHDEQRVALAPQLAPEKLALLRSALDKLDKSGELLRLRQRYGLQ